MNIQKLTEFSELHKSFMRNRRPSKLEKQLFEMGEEFKAEHPEIRLNERSNVIDRRTFAAHGTNAWALFSAFAFTNGQLLPKNEAKVMGIPIVAGELIPKKQKAKLCGYSSSPNTVSQNSISTIHLNSRGSYLLDALSYAENATNYHSCSYNDFREKWLKKYCKQGVDTSVIKKADKLLADQSMKDAYCKLSSIPVVVLGDRIGGNRIKSSIDNEYGCERFNIRVIIVNEKHKEYIRNLIDQINPKIARSIMYCTCKEINDFEEARNHGGIMYMMIGNKAIYNYKNTFVCDFEQAYKKLTFGFSDKFKPLQIIKKDLTKERIGGEHIENTSTITYYQNLDSTSETTVDDIDYSVVFTKSSQSGDHVLDEQLIDSVKSGDIEKVKSLLDGGANPNATSFNHALSIELGVLITKGNTLALGYAIYFGHTEIAKLLINRGACINRYSCSSGKKSHLANAAEHLRAEIIELLLKQGADVDVQDSQGETPISLGLRSNIICYHKIFKIIDVLFTFLVYGKTLTEDDRSKNSEGYDLQDCLTAFEKIKAMTHFGKLIESNKNGDTSVIFQYIGNENNAQELIEEFQNIKKDYGFQKGLSFIPKRLLGFLECVISKRDTGVAKNGYDDLEIGEEAANTLLGKLKEVVKKDNSQSETNSVRLFSTSEQAQDAKGENVIRLPKKAKTKPSKAIKTAVICGVIAALTVGVGFGIANVGLSTLVIAGIAAALVVGIVAFGITYAVSRPSDKLNEIYSKAAFAQPTRSPFFS
nr:ankyrin repeat domain-containing protein [Rickettsia endosymbiont of Ceutorhynchus assimilis]